MISPSTVMDPDACPWDERLRFVVDTMREMSLQVDPQEMNRSYRRRIRQILPVDRTLFAFPPRPPATPGSGSRDRAPGSGR